ncbi:hypothetical protein ACTHPB_27865 [Priestia megaterium]|uniref:hypothetical protein n=1 Tax=Priestia megaterium TaxID=1404 RepID=UPI003F7D3DAF
MVRTVYCRYIDDLGKEVGLTFAYGDENMFKEYWNRYKLSKDKLTQYNVYEGDKLVYSLHDEG